MLKKRRMNIATSLNSKYVRYAYVMLTSFLENHKGNMEAHIYLLYSDLTMEDREKLEGVVKSYSGFVHWLLIDREMFSEFRVTDDWSLEAYYRLSLMDILPKSVDRLLYLDVDIIVNQSLEEFYFADFGENLLYACKDICEAPFGDHRDVIFKEQIRKGFTYFCSGVLLLDIVRLRMKYCLNDYMDLARRLEHKMVAPDQDILNYMHWRETGYADSGKYNVFAWIAYTNNIHYPEVKKKASIIHFSGPKPWAGKYIRYDIEQLWWDYAKMTPFYYDFIEECIYEAIHDPMIYLQNCSSRMEIQSLSEALAKTTSLCQELCSIVADKAGEKHLEKEGVDEKKISFIICTDNGLYYDECIWYINHLHVPSGYEIDIICITEAESMIQAYNAAMKDSNAKYKVYLHQDVFIYNKYFIDDIIGIFRTDKRVGMIGMIGGIKLPQNAVIWNVWNIGRAYGSNYITAFPINGYQDENSIWIEAEAVDGMLMATQYDIEWREDLKLGWDFYDISQSLEFRRNGYKVVVPFQKEPWCMHDCGNSKLKYYDENRKKILEEYRDFFEGKFSPEYTPEYFLYQEEICEVLKKYLEQRMYKDALKIYAEICHGDDWNGDLQYALNMLEIYLAEEKQEDGAKGFFSDLYGWDEMRNKYDEIKFIIRHAENGTNKEAVRKLALKIKEKEISWQAVQIICAHSAVDRERAAVALLMDGI